MKSGNRLDCMSVCLFLNFPADDGKLKDRVTDFQRINSTLKLPKNAAQHGKLTNTLAFKCRTAFT